MAVRHVPAEFTSIQDAVNQSAPGDTIRVAGGVYGESVTIPVDRDRLAIIGSGQENVILQGDGTGVGLTISGSGHVTIAGLTVTGFATGIQVDTDDNIIRDVTVTGCGGDGIFVSPTGARNLFLRVAATNNGADGIEISGVVNYVIDCEFVGNGDDGIDINASGNLVVSTQASGNGSSGLDTVGNNTLAVGNRFVGNGRGMRAVSGGGSLVVGNFISRNRTVGGEFVNAAGGVVLANEVNCNQGQGLRFDGGGGFKVIRNEVENNGAQGIDLAGSLSLSLFDDNEIKENDAAGIRLAGGAAGNAVRRNELNRNRPDLEAEPPADVRNVFDENRCKRSQPPRLCC